MNGLPDMDEKRYDVTAVKEPLNQYREKERDIDNQIERLERLVSKMTGAGAQVITDMPRAPSVSTDRMSELVGQKEELVRSAAVRFLDLLRETVTKDYPALPVIALDPTPASVSKAAGKFRYKILMKTVNTIHMRKMVGDLLCRFQQGTLLLPKKRKNK